jgi:putative addiction module component (TIGR02574 family)
MSDEVREVLQAARQLTHKQREELVSVLADELARVQEQLTGEASMDIEVAWVAEAKRRVEAMRSGEEETFPIEQVNQELRALIDGDRSSSALV